MTHKSNAKSRIAKAMLLLFTLSCAVGAAGLSASSRELSADYSTQAVVELSQMQAKNPDDGIQPLSGKADVTASYLNVRSGPSASYSIVSTLKNKDVVTLLGRFSNNWYKISYSSNKIGYVTGVYLSVKEESPNNNTTTTTKPSTDNGMTAVSGTATPTTALNVRTGPSTAYTKIGVLTQGTKVTLVGKFKTNWYKIKYGSGYAYVCGDYLKITLTPETTAKPTTTTKPAPTATTKPATTTTTKPQDGGTDSGMTAFNGTAVTTGNLNARKGPSTAYTVLGVIKNGTKVATVGKFANGWYKIKYGSGYAYVSGAYLGNVTSGEGTTSGVDSGMTAYQAKGYVTEPLNVRSGPSTAYTKLGQLPTNTKITIVGKFATGWYKFEYNSGYAYVSANYIRLESAVTTSKPTTTTTTKPTTTTTTTKPNTDNGITDYTANGKTTTDLNVRSGPSTSYTKIGVIPKGTVVNIVGKFSSGWYKIKYNTGFAYVSGVYIDFSTQVELPQNPLEDILWIPARKPMPASYVPSGLVNLKSAYGLPTSGTQYLVGEVAAAYNEMYKAAKAAGVLADGEMVANSAYRSYASQQALYNSMANKQQVAKPGQSEHQMGVSVDIAQENYSTFNDAPLAVWLKSNAYKYGFILRYTADKSHITGIIDEPWHYRYVGKSYAKAIYGSKKCLEEYVDSL